MSHWDDIDTYLMAPTLVPPPPAPDVAQGPTVLIPGRGDAYGNASDPTIRIPADQVAPTAPATPARPTPRKTPSMPKDTDVNRVRRLADDAGARVAHLPTPGGIGFLVFVLIFFIFVIVPVSQDGQYTRLHLIWLTLTGHSKLADTQAGETATEKLRPKTSGGSDGTTASTEYRPPLLAGTGVPGFYSRLSSGSEGQ